MSSSIPLDLPRSPLVSLGLSRCLSLSKLKIGGTSTMSHRPVSTDSLKFHLGLPCPTLLRPAGVSPLKRPYDRFRGGPPTGQVACGCLLPLWTPNAVRLCFPLYKKNLVNRLPFTCLPFYPGWDKPTGSLDHVQ